MCRSIPIFVLVNLYICVRCREGYKRGGGEGEGEGGGESGVSPYRVEFVVLITINKSTSRALAFTRVYG